MALPPGYSHSRDVREKMSITRTGRPHSEAHKAAIAAAWTPARRAELSMLMKSPIPPKERARRKKLSARFGITPDEYDRMFDAQSGLCAICRMPESTTHNISGAIVRLSVDHNHDTGKIRGLLCRSCNLIIGNAADSVSRLLAAAKYLERT